jgi:hypothetical protein
MKYGNKPPQNDTPVDNPRQRHRSITLSEIDLTKPSWPPPTSPSSTPPTGLEYERLWQALGGVDETVRALSSSFQRHRKAQTRRWKLLAILVALSPLAARVAQDLWEHSRGTPSPPVSKQMQEAPREPSKTR